MTGQDTDFNATSPCRSGRSSTFHNANPRRTHQPRQLTRVIAAISGALSLALVISGALKAPESTESAWLEANQTKGAFAAFELGAVQNLKCTNERDYLLGLLNQKVTWSWNEPQGIPIGADVMYEVDWTTTGILTGANRSIQSDPFKEYTPPSAALAVGLTVDFSVRPVISGWEGEYSYGSALGVSVTLLGLPIGVAITCTGPLTRTAPEGGPAANADYPPLGLTAEASPTARTEAMHTDYLPNDPLSTTTTLGTSERATWAGTSTAATTANEATPTRSVTVTTAPTNVPTPPATQSTIPASAVPATAIPRAPGTLSPTARLEDVETITVGEEDLVVVIEGDTVPTDARQGATALEVWLGGGDPGTTWATFASDDPDEDGWRWAAINQKTGNVVYLR